MRVAGRCVALAMLFACADAVAATRELVYPFPPGGPSEVTGSTRAGRALRAMQRYAAPAFTDLLAMHVGQTLRGESGEDVIVTRKHRRGGGEAEAALARANPDGRTLLLAITPSALDVRYRSVGTVASMPYAWVAHAAAPPPRLEALLRGDSGRALAAHPGERTAAYRALEILRATQFRGIEPLAYNGGMAALNAVASDHVAVALVPLPAALPFAGSGRLQLLALADARRHPAIPQVPTGAEAGLRGAEAVVAFAVFASPATPGTVIGPIAQALARVDEGQEARELFSGFGLRLEYREARLARENAVR